MSDRTLIVYFLVISACCLVLMGIERLVGWVWDRFRNRRGRKP